MRNLKKYFAPILVMLVTVGLIMPTSGATAFQTTGLMFYFDFSNMSLTDNGRQLTDLSGNNRNGIIRGTGLTFDSTNKALRFPGGSTGTNYVELGGEFADFSNGVSIEFEGEFGATRAAWERIFDFGSTFVPGSSSNNQFWVGHMENSNELAIETWIDNVNQGRCHTVNDALGASNDRTFHKWLITIGDVNGTSKCRIYRDGVELDTQLRDGAFSEGSVALAPGGLNYPLPKNTARTNNYLGRSNWTGDADFEGSIKYIRLYNTALTPEQAEQNAINTYTVTYDEHGGSSVSDGTFEEDGPLTYPTNPTRSGYRFLGWFDSPTGGIARTSSDVAAGNESVTLHAQWDPNTYTVTYDEHGGSSVSDGSYVFGQTLTYPTNPTRAGYSFLGWFDSASGGSALSAATVSSRAADSILHAQWDPLPAQVLTWAPNNTSLMTSESPVIPSSLATSDGDGSITYAVRDAGSTGCSVNSTTGQLTFTGVGTCTVRATASSTSSYLQGTKDVSFNIGSTSPSMSLNLDTNSGGNLDDVTVSYGASGLKSGSTWNLIVRSTPQTLASGTFDASVLSGSAQLPANLSAGWHSITLSGFSPNGSALSHAVWFEVNEAGTVLRSSNEAPENIDSISSNSASLSNTGVDIYSQASFAIVLLALGLVILSIRFRIRATISYTNHKN